MDESMISFDQVRQLVGDELQLGDRTNSLNEDSLLLGAMPEFDSMAVVSIIVALEEQFDIAVEDDEITAETFETMGNLHQFINEKTT